jgi:RNA polymerase sigma factor for flagellar operon FliA
MQNGSGLKRIFNDLGTFFDPAKHRIKGAILDCLRQLDWASRDMRRRHRQVETATHELTGALEQAPTDAEVAEKLDLDLERWLSMKLEMHAVGLISASTRSEETADLPPPEFPSGPETHRIQCAHESKCGARSGMP